MPPRRLRMMNFSFNAEVMTKGLTEQKRMDVWAVFNRKMAEALSEVRRMHGVEYVMYDPGFRLRPEDPPYILTDCGADN